MSASNSDRAALRRAQVFGISLTEMMLILLFLMFLAAKGAWDLIHTPNPAVTKCQMALADCEKRTAALNEQLRAARNENAQARSELVKLKQWVYTLLIALKEKPLPPGDERFMADAEGRVGKVKGGVGRPNCLEDEGSSLLSVVMEDGFVTASRLWSDSDQSISVLKANPEIEQLVQQGRLPFGRFYQQASSIAARQKECVFHVIVVDKTTTKETYKPQLLQLERIFRRRIT